MKTTLFPKIFFLSSKLVVLKIAYIPFWFPKLVCVCVCVFVRTQEHAFVFEKYRYVQKSF